jgi:rhodanese-related sulfurtransferase
MNPRLFLSVPSCDAETGDLLGGGGAPGRGGGRGKADPDGEVGPALGARQVPADFTPGLDPFPALRDFDPELLTAALGEPMPDNYVVRGFYFRLPGSNFESIPQARSWHALCFLPVMIWTEPKRSSIHRPPPAVGAEVLHRELLSGSPPEVLDVREAPFFRAGHIEGSIHTPDSATTALLERVQSSARAVLVCDDGRLSERVARMLGVCGYPEVAYLKGGLRLWKGSGGVLLETTRSGAERRAHVEGASQGTWVGQFLRMIRPSILFAGLLGAAAVLGGFVLLLNR